MMTPDQVIRELENANPAPVRPIKERPSAVEALEAARAVAQYDYSPRPSVRRRALVVAASVFVLAVAVGLLTILFSGEPDVTDQPTTTPPTTVAASSTTTTTTTSIPSVDQDTLDRVSSFATAYSDGDFAAFEALLAPGLERIELRGGDGPVPWDREKLRIKYEIDAELNTTLDLVDCRVGIVDGTIRCGVRRVDDLVRNLELAPATDVEFILGFTDGLVTEWSERRPESPDYTSFAVTPFLIWLTETYPDQYSSVSGGGGTGFRTDIGFEAVIAELVAEWAASLE